MTTVKAVVAFSDGNLSMYVGEVREIDDDRATELIADGYVSAYEQPIFPTGNKAITANGTYDVSEYANAVVNVANVTITYDANGGTGTVEDVTVIAGNSVTLSDGTGLTAPEGKEFAGWATTDSAESPDVESPYTPLDDVTLYAVYTDAE